MNSTVRNILIAVAVGIVVGLLLGGVLPILGIALASGASTAGVGVAIGITYALLSRRKDN